MITDQRKLVADLGVAAVFLDAYLNVVSFTDDAKRTGLVTEVNLQQPIAEALPASALDCFSEAIASLRSGAEHAECSWQIDERHYLVRITPYHDRAQGIHYAALFTDVTRLRESETALGNLVAGTAGVTAEAFFPSLTRELARALNVQYSAVAELVRGEDPDRVQTLSFWSDTDWGENLAYGLEGTPCQEAIKHGLYFIQSGVAKEFPNDKILVELGAESYMGIRLVGDSNQLLGHMCVLGTEAIPDEHSARSILKTFAARASSELQRMRAQKSLLLAHDTLERRVAERTAELVAAQATERLRSDELAHAARMSTMGELVTELAHEINQPLTAIVSHASAALSAAKTDPELSATIAGDLTNISEQADRAAKVIRRIRKFIQKGDPQLVAVCPNTLVQDALTLIQGEARRESIRIELELASPEPKVRVDPIQVQQTILILAKNAIDAMARTPEGQRTLAISTRVAHDRVEFAFTDTGTGLSREQEDSVFESFYTTKAKGMGLGLSIAKTIVEGHSGTLSATGTKHGAIFRFTLPIWTGKPASKSRDSHTDRRDDLEV